MDTIKRSAKRFLLNAEYYNDFAARNPLFKPVTNNAPSRDKLCSEFAPPNPEYSEITINDNIISKLTPNNSHSFDKIVPTNTPHSFFALNCHTNQSKEHFKNSKRIADKFQNVLMMSPSDEETLSQIKQSRTSKVRFADEAVPSTAPSAPVTPSTPGTETATVTSPSSDHLYTDAFSFALSKIFSSTLMASLTKTRSLKRYETL